MTKDARLTLRITAELDTWLGHEAATRGLDKAAFARMALFERMNGAASAPVYASPAPSPPHRDVLTVASPPDGLPLEGHADACATSPPTSDPSPPDVDALVAEELNRAEALGLTEAQNLEAEAMAAQGDGGVRALARPRPRYSTPLPAFLSSQ